MVAAPGSTVTGPGLTVVVTVVGLVVGVAMVPLTHRLLPSRGGAGWRPPASAVSCVLGTAVVFGVLAWRLGATLGLLAALCFASVAVPLAVIDAATMRLPDVLVLPTSAVVVTVLVTGSLYSGHWSGTVRGLSAAVALGVVFLGISMLSRGQLGIGDIKLAALIGLVTAPQGFLTAAGAVVLGFLLAGTVAVAGLVAGGARWGSRVPLGPYLILGALGALLLPLS